MILAGDLGGTKVNLAVVSINGKSVRVESESTYRSQDFDGLESILKRFFSERGKPDLEVACFGMAGPVRQNRGIVTNLAWVVDGKALSNWLGVGVRVINDLEATGFGIPLLDRDQLEVLHEGEEDPTGHAALIAAGTGLGQALLFRKDTGFVAMPSEGGHCDFAPRNRLQIELLEHLLDQFGRVSYERVCSGPGLQLIFDFVVEKKGIEPSEWFRNRSGGDEDESVLISKAALEQQCPASVEALEIFAAVYAAESGNLALKAKATGGLYIGGGIAPKILPKLKERRFYEIFVDKGRMTELMKSIPLRVILEPKTALYGAARCGQIQLGKA